MKSEDFCDLKYIAWAGETAPICEHQRLDLPKLDRAVVHIYHPSDPKVLEIEGIPSLKLTGQHC